MIRRGWREEENRVFVEFPSISGISREIVSKPMMEEMERKKKD